MPSTTTISWAVGHSPFGPFAPFFHSQPAPPPPRASGCHKPQYTISNPSPYYLEQAPFYDPPTRSDPFVLPPPPAPTPSLFATLLALLLSFTTTIRTTIAATFTILLQTIGNVAILAFEIIEAVGVVLASREMRALLLASVLVRLLPEWKREVSGVGVGGRLGAGEGEEPLYRIFLAGREALGTGSVRGGEF